MELESLTQEDIQTLKKQFCPLCFYPIKEPFVGIKTEGELKGYHSECLKHGSRLQKAYYKKLKYLEIRDNVRIEVA